MRLIDADACPCNTCRTLCCEHPMQCYRFYTWRKNQAYDVEKIERQIKDYFLEVLNNCEEEYIPNAILKYNKAICKIFRSGGVE